MNDRNTNADRFDDRRNAVNSGEMPTARNEDVEFSEAAADEDDREAEQRALEADARAESGADGQ